VPLKVLELFSGLGGWRYALGDRGTVAAAYDISPWANRTYALNHGDTPHARELASVPAERLWAHGAGTWLMSPPCQPFCRMGNRHGLEDPRSRAFLRLMEVFDEAPPDRLVLENVEGFLGSGAHDLLIQKLRRHGFHWREFRLCPTQFGIPNQRPRVFVVASRWPLPQRTPPQEAPGSIASFLDAEEDPTLFLDSENLLRHKPGLDLVRAEDHRTACFIGGYGQRFVGSGSFLVTDRGLRRFSPEEVARFLGLPRTFRFPSELPREKRYKLLGNGLSIPVAAWVVRQLLD
jgi:DNA (cytosine-5)-methyltransferase 1/tRNA (cytosine38-C5)-methyltransferase